LSECYKEGNYEGGRGDLIVLKEKKNRGDLITLKLESPKWEV
jgi:hypothetical protein